MVPAKFKAFGPVYYYIRAVFKTAYFFIEHLTLSEHERTGHTLTLTLNKIFKKRFNPKENTVTIIRDCLRM